MSSFFNIDTSLKKMSYSIDQNIKNGDKSFKKFSSKSITFHCLKSKTNSFWLTKNKVQGRKGSCLSSKGQAEVLLRTQKLYQMRYIFCISFNRLILTYWHVEQPFSCSVFTEPNRWFKEQIFVVAYLAILFEASGEVAEAN